MAKKSHPPEHIQESVSLSKLHLDPHNPRFVFSEGDEKDEYSLIQKLFDHEDLQELLLSIRYSGWLEYEPLIVDKESGVVYEGNRRLAALKILSEPQLQRKFGAQPPAGGVPDRVSAIKVSGRAEARQYIGFKHINGPKKWDAMAKAKFAADWIAEGATLEEVSRSLGDTFNTVKRLVNGWMVFEQAKRDGFDPEKSSKATFHFSHLYTAISRASVREFLGLTKDDMGEPRQDPVPKEKLSQLKELMAWLYGQGSSASVITSQNPDLNRLADILANPRALTVLRQEKRLDLAWEEIDDLKPKRMEDALVSAQRFATDAAALTPFYVERNTSVESLTESLFKTVQKLLRDVRHVRDREVNDTE